MFFIQNDKYERILELGTKIQFIKLKKKTYLNINI